jgi:GNAT superfamily N-acetyltransferase
MIRIALPSDKNQMIELFSSVNLFDTNELEFMSDLIETFFTSSKEEGHYWVVNDDNGINAVAYYAPESFGKNVYNLYFIGVLPQYQGKGVGGLMLKYIENHLKELNQRLLLIETSGLPSFESTRQFYIKNDYKLEATIHEYYKEGDDKIVFVKKFKIKN